MSNTEPDPPERVCAGTEAAGTEILTPREVPLGGPRAMTVHRTLPQRARSLIGPWCFVDHFGPDDVAATGGMIVPRHPHTGLATVTLLFAGEVEHTDSTGFANTVRPAEVNLMIAGSGISHSEFSNPATRILHGVQLWYALPESERFGQPGSQHHVAETVELPGGQVWTYLGECAGLRSPVETRVEALAAQIHVEPGEQVRFDVDPEYELGLLVDQGAAQLSASGGVASAGGDATAVTSRELAYVPPGSDQLAIAAGDEAVRAVLIGGRPLGEQIVMWWNFVARSHDEVIAFRRAWQAEIGHPDAEAAGTEARDTELPAAAAGMDFGPFPAGTPDPLPAPRLPNARLRPRS